jgi:hypothetical protein
MCLGNNKQKLALQITPALSEWLQLPAAKSFGRRSHAEYYFKKGSSTYKNMLNVSLWMDNNITVDSTRFDTLNREYTAAVVYYGMLVACPLKEDAILEMILTSFYPKEFTEHPGDDYETRIAIANRWTLYGNMLKKKAQKVRLWIEVEKEEAAES